VFRFAVRIPLMTLSFFKKGQMTCSWASACRGVIECLEVIVVCLEVAIECLKVVVVCLKVVKEYLLVVVVC